MKMFHQYIISIWDFLFFCTRKMKCVDEEKLQLLIYVTRYALVCVVLNCYFINKIHAAWLQKLVYAGNIIFVD